MHQTCIFRQSGGNGGIGLTGKINTASAFVIGDLSLVNTLVVENTTDERWVSAMKEKGVAVIASQ